MLLDLLRARRYDELRELERIAALGLKRRQLFAAYLDLIADRNFILNFLILILCHIILRGARPSLFRYFSTVRTLYLSEPTGASISTMSPAVWPSIALPNGESSEMRHSIGFAS